MYTWKDYVGYDRLPHIWCSGCGNGIIFNALGQALEKMQLPLEKVVIVSGSGCFAKIVNYPGVNTVKMLHGRVLSGATGIAMANPELTVFALMGDGDGTTIGGNHLIHAARRNINVTAILGNNYNYGMTGGQYSGTTPEGSITATSRYGLVEDGFDACKLVEAAGASYVARTTAYDVLELQKMIIEATEKPGFAFIDVLAACPTHYGRLNKMGTPAEQMLKIKEGTVPVAKAAKMSPEELKGKLLTGKLVDRNDREDYAVLYAKMAKEARGE
ncbi:MAG: 2-oxoacid:ferredoxin oxidoreductase subunit beta [Oscillospiraceae bacterium]|nr:2-oxoacid:ferredoxin oxidoreductase subunit beta [Oscillospiraceae bacterium]